MTVLILALSAAILKFLVDLADLKADVRDLEKEVHSLRHLFEGHLPGVSLPETNVAPVKQDNAQDVPSSAPVADRAALSSPDATIYKDTQYAEDAGDSTSRTYDDFPQDDNYQDHPYLDPAPQASAAPKQGMEFSLGTKLPVWIGAIALIFAGFYLVKYSVESGWLQPAVRLALGGFMGFVLLGAGSWLANRPAISNAVRMAQGLVGAGLVTLYGCLYAAVNLYGMLPPLVGFGGMSAVTVIAVFMSWRHGQPIAIFGLIGGLATPALISSDDPNALALFTYLFVLCAGLLFLFSRREWWLLAVATVIGMFLWLALWVVGSFRSDDAVILVLFALGLCALVLMATGRALTRIVGGVAYDNGSLIHSLNMMTLLGGVGTVIWMSILVDMTGFDWMVLGLLTLAGYVLAFLLPLQYWLLVCFKMLADLVLFLLWDGAGGLGLYMAIAAGLLVLYMAIPQLLIRWVRDPRLWALLQGVSSIAILLICYFRLPVFPLFEIPFAHFWGLWALLFSGWAICMANTVWRKGVAGSTVTDYLLAIYCTCAAIFMAEAIAFDVPSRLWPVAYTMMGLSAVAIYGSTGIASLRRIVSGLATLFLAVSWQPIVLSAVLIGASLVGTTVSPRDVKELMPDSPLVQLGIPALLWLGALCLHARTKEKTPYMTGLMLLSFLFSLSFASYCMVKLWLHGSLDYLSQESTFMQRGIITTLLAATGISLFYLSEKYADVFSFVKTAGVLLFKLAIFRVIYFDLLIMNPYFHADQKVGIAPFLNGITLVYGGAFLMCLWAVKKADWQVGTMAARAFYSGLGLFLLFVLTSLTVRQFFHGENISSGAMSNTEFYVYSIVWLLTGLAILAYGIVSDNRLARLASLAFMLLTIGKVFLFDAAELQGLYRVFSFLGLGVSLIGLSYFYSRFVFRKSA